MAITANTEFFETERLTARRIRPDDGPALAATLTDPGYGAGFGHPADAEGFAERQADAWGRTAFVFTLFEKETGKVAGFASVLPDQFAADGILGGKLEIALAPGHQGRRLGRESVLALIGWAFGEVVYSLGQRMAVLHAVCRTGNAGALALMRSLAAHGVREIGQDIEVSLPVAAGVERVSGSGRVVVFEVRRGDFAAAGAR